MMLVLLGVALAGTPRSGTPTVTCDSEPASTSREAFEALLVTHSPEAHARLARCLDSLGLPSVAQRHWMEALRARPDEDLRREVIGQIHALGEELGDLTSIAWTVHNLGEHDLPWGGPGVDAALYNHARELMNRERWRMAAEVLGDLGPDFRHYGWSRLHLGRAWERAGKPDLAATAYEQAITASYEDEQAVVRDLAVVSLANLFARQGATEGAERMLSRVPTTSPLHGDATLSIAHLRLDAGLDARPFLKRARRAARTGALLPALGVLELRADLAACRERRAQRRAGRWTVEMERLLLVTQGVAGDRPDGLLLYAQHLGPHAVDVGVPDGFADRLATHEAWVGFQAHLRVVEAELDHVRTIDHPGWQPVLGDYLVEILVERRQQLRAAAGRVFAAEVHRLGSEVRAALTTGAHVLDEGCVR